MNNLRNWVVILTLSLLLPVSIEGQACLGNGAVPGQGYAAASASFTDGAWALGGTAGGNLDGPVSVQAGVSHTLFDNTDLATTSFGGSAAVDLASSGSGLSACPVMGISYQWLSNDAGLNVDADGVIVGGGFAVGTAIESKSSLRFIPQAIATVVHDRATVSGGGVSVTESETYGSFSGAFLLAGNSVYAGPSASVTTLEGSDPVFSATLGFTF